MGINKIILLGHVGRDPEVTNTEKAKIARFGFATMEIYRDKSGDKQNKIIWHNIVVFCNLASVVESYIKKGSHLYIEGKQVNRHYEKDGVTKYISEVIANKIEMLSKLEKSSKPDIKEPDIEMGDESDDIPF